MKILLVEDDRGLNEGIVLAMQQDRYEFMQCYDLTTARKEYDKGIYQMVILDINLPDGNGFDFLKEVRRSSEIPVLILTAHDMEMDEVMGLELGADDYMTKPFSLMVLRARIHNIIRKLEGKKSVYSIGKMQFDFDQMVFYKDGLELTLSKTEQRLLRYFMENKGIVLSRELLLDRIWSDGADYVDANALSVTVKRLRDKIEDNPSKPQYIHTVYSQGYIWKEER